jgi:hypothetical protein
MNDENFDKIFGDKLSAGKDFRFTEAKWGKMEGKIVAFEAEQRLRRLLMWLCVPLLALIGFSVWEGRALHTAQNDLVRLTEEVKTLRTENRVGGPPSVFSPNLTSQNSQTVVKNDTIYRHVVVKRYDTIFQTVVQRVLSDVTPSKQEVLFSIKQSNTGTVVSGNDAKSPEIIENTLKKVENTAVSTTALAEKENTILKNNNAKPTEHTATETTAIVEKENTIAKNNDAKPTEKAATETPIIAEKDKTVSENNDIKPIETAVLTEKTGIKPPPKAIETDSPQTTDPLSIKPEKQPTTVVAATKTLLGKLVEKVGKQEEKLLPIIKPLKNIGFEIGVSGGLAMIDGRNIVRQDGFTAGARVGILLGKRWKIVGETQFLDLNYDVDKISSNQDIPTVAPPTPNDVFNIVRLEQPYIHYSVGLQYVLLQKTLKPYLGLSLLGQSKLEEKFVHHFKNQVTREDVFVKTQRRNHRFEAPFLRLQMGAEYPIFKKLKGQLEGSYDVQLNHVPQFEPTYQLKGGVLYRF